MANKSSRQLTRILISLVFLVSGSEAVYRVISQFVQSFELSAILAGAAGILMFLTGLFGLMKNKLTVCRILAVIVCILNAASFVTGLLALSFNTSALTTAILAWVYFDCT